MTIEDSLILLNNTKEAIKTAIENKGVTVGSAPFADYAGKIDLIPTGIDLPGIGDAFEGGYFVGVMILSDGIYASIIAPSTTGESGDIAYKTSNTDDAGATDFLDTRVNMAVINDADHPAAQFCTSLSIGGKTDWMLPSLVQLLSAGAELSGRGIIAPANPIGLTNARDYWPSGQAASATCTPLRSGASARIGTLTAKAKVETANCRARAFRLEKLD